MRGLPSSSTSDDMTSISSKTTLAATFAAALLTGLCAGPGRAETTPAKPAAKAKQATRAPSKKAAVPPKVEYAPAEPATAEQKDAAERVYYGTYDCEFKQTIDISKSAKYPAFVDVKHANVAYLMKPVLSSTGAVRLEDIRGETLMVQISSKSMLLNVKTAHRIVDDCISPKQRELLAEAKAAKAAAEAAPVKAITEAGTTAATTTTATLK